MELTLVVLHVLLNAGIKVQATSVCHHSIFCNDELLDLVQGSHIFPDSKEFVDRPLLGPADQVQLGLTEAYSVGGVIGLEQSVLNWTSPPGSDLLEWEPSDWNPRPLFINGITDLNLQKWAIRLHHMWKLLGRQASPSVTDNPELHSLLPLPYPFIIPGGRFRESYYWDNFWVLHGLILGEMEETARHIIENMASLVLKYGFVPNGGRIYYTERSQPPLLTQMVDLYYKFTSNLTFVEAILPALSKEYDFWMTNRSINLSSGVMNYYSSPTNTPRPESYAEDVAIASQLPVGKQSDFYSDIASAAESGWDFSSRWFERGSSNLSSIRTRKILPVDLNAIMCQNELTLHHLYAAVGDSARAQHFLHALEERQSSFDNLFWNEESGLWSDRDLDSDNQLADFYASSLVPLLWGCNSSRLEVVLETLESLSVLEYPGGIPASLVVGSEQQWDYPNAWAPYQWFPVAAWAHSDLLPLREAARRIAKTWITTTYSAWNRYNNTMFEKYLCTEEGSPGEGGEYAVQSGFGWTNGIVLYFLWLYPDLDISNDSIPGNSTAPPPSTTDDSLHGNSTAPPPSTTDDSLHGNSTAPPPSTTDDSLHGNSTPPPSSTTDDSLPGNTTPPPPSTTDDSLPGNSTVPPTSNSLGWIAAPVLVLLAIAVTIVMCALWCRWLFLAGERRYWGRVHNEHLRAAGGNTDAPTQTRESSEETEGSVDNDRRGLFTWNV